MVGLVVLVQSVLPVVHVHDLSSLFTDLQLDFVKHVNSISVVAVRDRNFLVLVLQVGGLSEAMADYILHLIQKLVDVVVFIIFLCFLIHQTD